jgi:hypothetical protein
VVAALFVASLAACAERPSHDQIGPPPGLEAPAPTDQGVAPTLEGKAPSGRVTMREVPVAGLGSAGGGDGTPTFWGRNYALEIAGLGVGGSASRPSTVRARFTI